MNEEKENLLTMLKAAWEQNPELSLCEVVEEASGNYMRLSNKDLALGLLLLLNENPRFSEKDIDATLTGLGLNKDSTLLRNRLRIIKKEEYVQPPKNLQEGLEQNRALVASAPKGVKDVYKMNRDLEARNASKKKSST